MSPREAFKFGFLARCAEEGLTEAQVQERVKTAALRKQALPGVSDLLGAAGWLAGTGAATAVLGGGLTGRVAGHTLARLQDPGYDADAIKRQELMSAYGTLADELDEERQADKELAEGAQPTAG